MSCSIAADVCEGLYDCIPSCPVEFVVIDPGVCTNCGVCP